MPLVSNRSDSCDEPEFGSLNEFLAAVERRAFLMARVSLGNQDDAMDTVQDAMLVMVRKYSHKPVGEWRPLFFKILQNRILDVHRHRKVRNRFTGWLTGFNSDAQDEPDLFQQVADVASNNPAHQVEQGQSMEALSAAIAALPLRQQQAFMLRCWEGLSTADTAASMKCSEGSVKTHYFRALQSLKEALKEHYDEHV
ncbi:MAG: hypothetical protein VR73_05805 [Gammaproteobacteria bacterium BRH_c0]|nr:MAG: hypothetical protein VR73_05805 [Gammaproteobacteria bacterium BRH_c0]